ncbi:hypothetical protein LCGC14_1969180, partial [marine sediment metagenome]
IGGMEGSKKRTVSEERELLKAHRPAIKFVNDHMGSHGRIAGITTGSTRAVVARAWYSVDLDKLQRFCEVLRTGLKEHESEQPIAKLWTVLVKAEFGGSRRSDRVKRYAMTERALLAYIAGERINSLHPVSKEMFPLPNEVPAKERKLTWTTPTTSDGATTPNVQP